MIIRPLRVLVPLWWIAAPFVLEYAWKSYPQRQSVTLGLLVLPFAVAALVVPGVRVALFLAGLWLFGNAVFNPVYDLAPVAWMNDAVTGVIAVVLAVLPPVGKPTSELLATSALALRKRNAAA